MTRVRETLWLPVIVAGLAVAAVFWGLTAERSVARTRVRYEDEALAQLHVVAAAQSAFHERHGRYGWLAELRAEGLLAGQTFATDDDVLCVLSPRYRIDVLLPVTLGSAASLRIAPRSAGHANAALERKHFAVAARPWGAAPSGWRSYCTDESGIVYVNEGVSDQPTRHAPPLPDLHLTEGGPADSGGMRWWRLDRLPPR